MSAWARLCLAAVVTVVALPAAAAASPLPPPIIPPVDNLYDNLGSRWWQYVLAQPASNNPLTDPTGASCRTGQSGPVFFLVGTNGSGTAHRTLCKVPFGRALFFPPINGFDTHVPPDGLDTPELVWQDMHDTLGWQVDRMNATVDGVRVGNLSPASSPYRGCAGPADLAPGCARPFTLTFPAGNLFGIPAGQYYPTVADGFYLLLAPPSLGVHTISFGGSGFGNGAPFTTQTTYKVRVTVH